MSKERGLREKINIIDDVIDKDIKEDIKQSIEYWIHSPSNRLQRSKALEKVIVKKLIKNTKKT